jgi:hypothetical protein
MRSSAAAQGWRCAGIALPTLQGDKTSHDYDIKLIAGPMLL